MVTVRGAGTADAEAIERVRASSWQAAYEGLLAPDVITRATDPSSAYRRRDLLWRDPTRHALIAEVDGEPAGMAVYGPDRRPPTTPRGRARAELYSIYVHPTYWSAGVGRALLERTVEDVRASGHDRLSLWVLETNARARRFYDRAGLWYTGERFRDDRVAGAIEVRYEREV